MNWIISTLTGMGGLTDQVIAMDLLMSAKTAVRNYALAATETINPALKATFERHLFEAVETHARITAYAMERGYYQPYDVPEQWQFDQKTAETALNLPG